MEIKVYIEIPEGSNVKYELDEETEELTIDRLMPTAMSYPVNYGLIHETHGEDGDALDAIVFISEKVIPGVVVKCNVIGLLEMEDEAGIDHKVVAVPLKKVDPICGEWKTIDDIPHAKRERIRHFFERYKDLEKGKWVKLKDWKNAEVAGTVIEKARARFKNKSKE